jgi:hypothetical protein
MDEAFSFLNPFSEQWQPRDVLLDMPVASRSERI